jgi:hypothetical protein
MVSVASMSIQFMTDRISEECTPKMGEAVPDRLLLQHGWRPLGVSVLIACASFCTFSPAAAEQFMGQFELKTLESAPGRFEFQSQNAWSRGQPARRIASGPDGIEFDENAVVRQRYALELEMGFTSILQMHLHILRKLVACVRRLRDP